MIRPTIAALALLAALTGCGGGSAPLAAPLVGDQPTASAVVPPASTEPPTAVVAPRPAPAKLAAVPTPTPRVVIVEVPAPTPAPTPAPRPAKPVPTPKPVATPKPTPTPIPPHDHPAPSGPDGTTCPDGYHFQYGGTVNGVQQPNFCAAGRQHTPCTEEGATGMDILYTEEVCHNGTWDHPVAP